MDSEAIATLNAYADRLHAMYALPVYLVGSALRSAEPRDVDVRIEMPAAQFAALFGDPDQWERQGATGDWGPLRKLWSDECVLRTKEGWRETDLNIDFQIYPEAYCRRRFGGLARMRLDSFG